jgi:hypothetical protein
MEISTYEQKCVWYTIIQINYDLFVEEGGKDPLLKLAYREKRRSCLAKHAFSTVMYPP